MHRLVPKLVGCALAAMATVGFAKSPGDGDTVVASRAGAVVTLAEVDARMDEVPAESRGGVMADPSRLEAIVDDLLLTNQVAKDARGAGTDKDPKFRAALALLTNRLLVAFHSEAMLTQAPKADFETLAHESYLSDPSRFVEPGKLKVRHILIRTGPGCRTAEMTTQLAEKVRAEALAGKDFAELARTYTEDETSRADGGALPPFGPGRMLANFENAAKELKEPGDISPVVTTKYGLHIIQLIGHEPDRQRSYEEVKPELMKTLAKEHADRFRREKVDQMRSQRLDANPEVVASLSQRYAGDAGKAAASPQPAPMPLPKPEPEAGKDASDRE